MNKKGQSQVSQIGVFIGLFIVLLVGLILLQSSAQQVGDVVNTVTLTVNQTITAPANGAAINLNGRAVSSFVAFNLTNGTVGHTLLITSGNFTILDNQVVNGLLTARLQVDDALYENEEWNVTYIYEPETFIGSSGGRALANLIILMFAISLLIISILPVVKQRFEWLI